MARLFDDSVTPPRVPGRPLADRIRPAGLDEFLGQEELIGTGTIFRRLIDSGEIGASIFWGPPGSGKTTLARIIAGRIGIRFFSFSAILTGIREVRQVMEAASRELKSSGRRTLLLIDEIHRFNKAQQDAFLAHVERGEILLIGATTQNPSFEVIPALLSRSTVYLLKPLPPSALRKILDRALRSERGLAPLRPEITEADLDSIAARCGGDARRALNFLERMVLATPPGEAGIRSIRGEDIRAAGKDDPLSYDKGGEEHFNLISALQKSLRNSDPQAGLYWLARMLEAGEDPLYVARRLVRTASEDIGNADPRALQIALTARDAIHFLGLPEGKLALAQAVTYLATAPKSNALLTAYNSILEDLRSGKSDPVPLHLRNAPTRLMKEVGYGKGYQYAHDDPEGTTSMECLPDRLRGREYYRPGEEGFERTILERMRSRKQRIAARRSGGKKPAG